MRRRREGGSDGWRVLVAVAVLIQMGKTRWRERRRRIEGLGKPSTQY